MKKGFTLIELLAVIVILAIIALIATPTILGVVETARKGAAESSVLGYIDAVEKQAMINEMDETDGNSLTDATFTDLEQVSVKGQRPNDAYTIKTVNGSTCYVHGVTTVAGEVQDTVFVTKDNKYDVTYTKSTGKAVAVTHNASSYATACPTTTEP